MNDLRDPFPDEENEEEETSLLMEDEIYAIIAGYELTSLHEPKQSTDWPTWDAAIGTELKLPKEMGTWESVHMQ